MKRYRDGKWFVSPHQFAIVHTRPGEYEEGVISEIDISIPENLIHSLVQFLFDNGHIRPIQDNQTRAEDIKIIHRLLDVIQKER